MPNIKINGKAYNVDKGLTVMQVCDNIGVEIPRFCYHEKLNIAGNCRMCLVEMVGSKKPIPSCTQEVSEGMQIITDSQNVDKVRQGILEFILINHPLDCPICDQGGECDLQDQTMKYGLYKSVYKEEKRAVPEKNFGPLIKTVMTRCIHCTRCIRFADDIAGTYELGGISRGEHMEIATYVDSCLTSELSGNLADICPVGALTHHTYAFKGRPWELTHTDTIDVMDAVGSNVRADSIGLSVVRILPRVNEDINEEWLADKSRYICDALRVQRLDKPLVKHDNKFVEVTWDEAFLEIKKVLIPLSGRDIAAIAGDFADVEAMVALKDLINSLDSEIIDSRQDGALIDNKVRASYIFNTTISGIEESDTCLIINSNPRIEAPIINARIRKRYLQGNFPIALIGKQSALNYQYQYLGDSTLIIQELLDGKHHFTKILKQAKKPMIIIGRELFNNSDAEVLLYKLRELSIKYGVVTKDFNGFNVLHTKASNVGGLDIGFVPKDKNFSVHDILSQTEANDIKFVWLLGADEINTRKLENTFVVYQGHHGDKGAAVANVILPGGLWLEKDATYVNTEGRVQRSNKAVHLLGEAKEDWKIIRAFSECINKTLPYNTLKQVRERMIAINPIFNMLDNVVHNEFLEFGTQGKINHRSLVNSIKDYYLTDIISRNSATMAECSKVINPRKIQEEKQVNV